MATALSHHHHQQRQDQTHQHNNPPIPFSSLNSSSGSSSGVSSSPARSSPPTPSTGENYCKDCGVMFESSRSLEVHLSYHRANLLTKWGNNQDTPIINNNMEHTKSGPYSYPPTQHYPPSSYQHHPFTPEQQYESTHENKVQGHRTPEEILDLDSNKVHVYNYPPNNFYRPYLMAQNQPHFNHEQQIYRQNFDFGHPQYPPPEIQPYQTQQPPPPPPHPPSSQRTVDFRGSFPPPEQGSQNSEPETNIQEVVKKVKKVKVEETLGGSSPGGQKTKGWKGGECKRPKTYNCIACNKWFTSSGHLKRHYGTTLHKNSLRQKGENPDEHPTVTGKKTKEPKRSPGDDDGGQGGSGSGGDSSSTNPITPKPEEIPQQLTPIVKSSPVFNGSPRLHSDFYPSNTTSAPPSSQPTYLPLYTNGGPQGQTGSYPMSMGLPPHHPQFHHHYDNNQPNVYGVPPTIYNGNYPHLINGEQLPPFSTVLSYDQQYAPPGLYIQSHHQLQGHPPPDTDSESGIHSVSNMSNAEHLNGESPEAVRSASTASGLEVSDSAPSSPSTGFSSGSDESPSSTMNEGHIKCPNCSKTFNRTCYLTQHTNSSHSGGRPFKCPTCGKRFTEEPALSDHVAKHGSDKPYKCDLCPKQFNHKTDLRRHLCLHTGEKPFNCSICGKGFIRKDHMTKHLETHRKGKGGQPLQPQQ